MKKILVLFFLWQNYLFAEEVLQLDIPKIKIPSPMALFPDELILSGELIDSETQQAIVKMAGNIKVKGTTIAEFKTDEQGYFEAIFYVKKFSLKVLSDLFKGNFSLHITFNGIEMGKVDWNGLLPDFFDIGNKTGFINWREGLQNYAKNQAFEELDDEYFLAKVAAGIYKANKSNKTESNNWKSYLGKLSLKTNDRPFISIVKVAVKKRKAGTTTYEPFSAKITLVSPDKKYRTFELDQKNYFSYTFVEDSGEHNSYFHKKEKLLQFYATAEGAIPLQYKFILINESDTPEVVQDTGGKKVIVFSYVVQLEPDLKPTDTSPKNALMTEAEYQIILKLGRAEYERFCKDRFGFMLGSSNEIPMAKPIDIISVASVNCNFNPFAKNISAPIAHSITVNGASLNDEAKKDLAGSILTLSDGTSSFTFQLNSQNQFELFNTNILQYHPDETSFLVIGSNHQYRIPAGSTFTATLKVPDDVSYRYFRQNPVVTIAYTKNQTSDSWGVNSGTGMGLVLFKPVGGANENDAIIKAQLCMQLQSTDGKHQISLIKPKDKQNFEVFNNSEKYTYTMRNGHVVIPYGDYFGMDGFAGNICTSEKSGGYVLDDSTFSTVVNSGAARPSSWIFSKNPTKTPLIFEVDNSKMRGRAPGKISSAYITNKNVEFYDKDVLGNGATRLLLLLERKTLQEKGEGNYDVYFYPVNSYGKSSIKVNKNGSATVKEKAVFYPSLIPVWPEVNYRGHEKLSEVSLEIHLAGSQKSRGFALSADKNQKNLYKLDVSDKSHGSDIIRGGKDAGSEYVFNEVYAALKSEKVEMVVSVHGKLDKTLNFAYEALRVELPRRFDADVSSKRYDVDLSKIDVKLPVNLLAEIKLTTLPTDSNSFNDPDMLSETIAISTLNTNIKNVECAGSKNKFSYGDSLISCLPQNNNTVDFSASFTVTINSAGLDGYSWVIEKSELLQERANFSFDCTVKEGCRPKTADTNLLREGNTFFLFKKEHLNQVEKSVENIKWAGQNYSKEFRVDEDPDNKFLPGKYLFDKWTNRGIKENKEAIAGLEKLGKDGTYTELNISEAFRETQYIYQTNNTSRHYVHAIYPASETKPDAGDFYSDGHRTCNVSSAMMNLNSLYPKEFKKLMADYKSKELEKKPEIIQLANQRDEILSCTGLGKYCDEKKNLFPPVGNDLRGDIRTKNQNAKKEWESLAEIIWVYEHTVGFKKVGCPKADAYLYAECQQKAVTRFLQEYGYIKAEDNTYVISSELTNYTANQELLYNILSTNNNFFAYVGNYYTGSGHVVPVYGTASKGSDKYFIMNDPYGSISLDENKRAFYPKNKESGLANVRTINTLAHARSGVHFATMPYFMLYAKCKNNDELCVKSIDERINKWNEDFKLYLNGNKFKKTKLE